MVDVIDGDGVGHEVELLVSEVGGDMVERRTRRRELQALEQELGHKIDATISSEIGGANSMEPMLTAAQAGIPVVDGDGMGRAFPELQMVTHTIFGIDATPMAMSVSRRSWLRR